MREIAVIILLFVVSLCQATEPNLVAHYDCNSIIYTVSGTLSPDATGVYIIGGQYNNYAYFKRADNAYYIWFDETDTWFVSTVLGTVGTFYWSRTPDPETDLRGNYGAYGTATGTLTFSAIIPDSQGYSNGTFITVPFLTMPPYDDPNLSNRLVANKLWLNGVSDYVNLNKTFRTTLAAIGARGFTVNVAFVVRTINSQPFMGVVNGDFATGLGGFYFGTNDIGGLVVFYKTAGETAITITNTEYGISAGPEYVASCVFREISSSQANVSLYLNGVLKFTQNYSVHMNYLSLDIYNLWLGQHNAFGVPACYFVGSFDDVRLYNRALTAQEIAILYLNLLLGDGNYLDPANVRYGTVYEVNDVNLTGTLITPSYRNVRYGVDFNDSNSTIGSLVVPSFRNVRTGIDFNDSNNTGGALDLPEPNNVRYGIQFDNNTKSGLLDLPDVNKVSQGTQFDNETKTGIYKDKRRMRIF